MASISKKKKALIEKYNQEKLRNHAMKIGVTLISPETVALGPELIKLIKDGSINNNSAKNILEKISLSNQNPNEIVESMNLKQESSEDSLNEIIVKTIDKFPEEYKRIMEGEVKLLSFFVGQSMKLSKGKGNPKIINKLLKEKFKIN